MKISEDIKNEIEVLKRKIQEAEIERLKRVQYQNAFNEYLGHKETEAYWDLSSEYFAAYRPSEMGDIEAIMRVEQQQATWENFMASFKSKAAAAESLAKLAEKPKSDDGNADVMSAEASVLKRDAQKQAKKV